MSLVLFPVLFLVMSLDEEQKTHTVLFFFVAIVIVTFWVIVLVVSRPCFIRLPPDIFRPKSLPLLYTFIQSWSCLLERNPYFAAISRSVPFPLKYSLTAAAFISSV